MPRPKWLKFPYLLNPEQTPPQQPAQEKLIDVLTTRTAGDEVPEHLLTKKQREIELRKRLELRDLFRDQQVFEESLPRSHPSKDDWTLESDIKTWTDHCNGEARFMAMDSTRVIFSSVVSGVVVSCISTPFDVVKNFWIYTHQLDSVRTGATTKEVIQLLYAKNGWRTFYTGFIPSLITVVSSNLIFFTAYEQYRYLDNPGYAGAKSRLFSVIMTAPFEYIKTRLQANAGDINFTELWRTIQGIERVRYTYKGFFVALLRDLPFSAIYWELNEYIKAKFAKYDESYKQRHTFTSKFVYPFISGAVSAGVAAVVTQPCDVVKTTIQASPLVFRRRGVYYFRGNGLFSTAAYVWKQNGLKGFYVGVVPRVAKVVPTCAVLLASYDFCKAIFTKDPQLDYDGF